MRLTLILLALLAWTPAHAFEGVLLPKVEFSATAIHESGKFKTREIIHYANGKLRIDRGKGFITTIIDMNTESQSMLMDNHTYVTLPLDNELFRHYFAQDPRLTDTRRVGVQRLNGIETTKYDFGHSGQLDAAGTFWLSHDDILMRRVYDDGVKDTNIHHVEFLTDLHIGKQPASLFDIPAGYKPAK